MARKITKEELATYIESVFKNKKFMDTMRKCAHLGSVRKMSDDISFLCTEYFLATGDPSPDAIERICDEMGELYQNPQKPRYGNMRFSSISPLANDLADSAGREIVDYYARALGCSNPISTADMARILHAVSEQANQTTFHTHSFPGVLSSKVKKEGLDISGEMFTDEMKTLGGIGIRTPFKTGVLNTVELSRASFGYCHTSPERVKLMFEPSTPQQDNEPLDDYLKRGLKEKIDSASPTDEDRARFTEAGTKIIDFYNETTSSCIAIMDMGSGSPRSLESTQGDLFTYMQSMPSTAGFTAAERQQLAGDIEQWNAICGDKTIGRAEKFARLCPIVDRWRSQCGESIGKKTQTAKEEMFFKTMSMTQLPNFETSNANGYDIASGRIAPEDMAIATIQDPYKYYPAYRKFLEQRAARQATQAPQAAPAAKAVDAAGPAKDLF